MEEYKKDIKVLERSIMGAISAECVNRSRMFLKKQSMRLGPYLGRIVEGGWIIDREHLKNDSDILSKILNSPMLDLRLKEGDTLECSTISKKMAGPGGMQGELLAIASGNLDSNKWRGLDSISLSDYVSLWASYGAHTGQRKGDQIHWIDGTKDIIPSYEYSKSFLSHFDK